MSDAKRSTIDDCIGDIGFGTVLLLFAFMAGAPAMGELSSTLRRSQPLNPSFAVLSAGAMRCRLLLSDFWHMGSSECFADDRPQTPHRRLLDHRGPGRGAGGVSAELRAGVLLITMPPKLPGTVINVGYCPLWSFRSSPTADRRFRTVVSEAGGNGEDVWYCDTAERDWEF